MHRQAELRRDGDQDSAARGAVELGHDQARDARDLLENLDLRQRILSHGGVEHEEHRMRRGGVHFLYHPHDFFQLVHQRRLVLQAPRGVYEQNVGALLLRGSQRLESEACRIGPRLARHHRSACALAPDLELIDAAARKVSPDASITLRPSAPKRAASLPMVAVLPEPLTPATRMTKGLAPSITSGLATGASTLSTSAARMAFTSSGVTLLS